MNPNAEFDLILYGATGFTGRLVAEYLVERCGVGGGVRWALGGRNLAKLAAVRDEGGASAELPLVVADSTDPGSLRAAAARTKCLVTTVGPYTHYGSDVVAACVEAGTDYVDLCGEVVWMSQMIETHHEQAKQTGARIVHSCGFDSVPFDLGVQFLQEHARAKFGAPCSRVRGRVRKMRGTLSGGTLASLRATLAVAAEDPNLKDRMHDPFSLANGFRGPEQPDLNEPVFDATLGVWLAPFIMAPINTKNIHRSNALQGHAYGEDFVYDEMLVTGTGDSGRATAEKVAADRPLEGDGGYKPGEGPSKKKRDAGHYDVLFVGTGVAGEEIRVAVTGDKDPGYGSTSKMIAEAALCLIRDCAPTPGGIWTPASAMGVTLRERLIANAGLTFEVEA